jgi:hypothetical protein
MVFENILQGTLPFQSATFPIKQLSIELWAQVFTLCKALGPWALPEWGICSALPCRCPSSEKGQDLGLYWN